MSVSAASGWAPRPDSSHNGCHYRPHDGPFRTSNPSARAENGNHFWWPLTYSRITETPKDPGTGRLPIDFVTPFKLLRMQFRLICGLIPIEWLTDVQHATCCLRKQPVFSTVCVCCIFFINACYLLLLLAGCGLIRSTPHGYPPPVGIWPETMPFNIIFEWMNWSKRSSNHFQQSSCFRCRFFWRISAEIRRFSSRIWRVKSAE